jgi:hypothetical protein
LNLIGILKNIVAVLMAFLLALPTMAAANGAGVSTPALLDRMSKDGGRQVLAQPAAAGAGAQQVGLPDERRPDPSQSPAMSKAVTSWATAVSKQKDTGRAIIFRYAQSFRQGFQKSAFPERMILVWKYHSTSGMPATEERQAMDRMEDLLAPLIEQSGISVLALVSTEENLREWIFYAKAEQDFLAALNQALAGQPHFPIEVHAAQDPEWSSFESFRKGVHK